MKEKGSVFLESKKTIAKKLVAELMKTYGYASILAVDTKGKRYFMKKTGVSLEDSAWAERGYVVRVYTGTQYFEHSFNQLDDNNYKDVMKAIRRGVDFSNQLIASERMGATKYDLIEEENVEAFFASDYERSYQDIGHDNVLDNLRNIMNDALSLNDNLVDVRVAFEEVHVSKLFISSKKTLSQSYVWTNGAVIPIAYADGAYKYSYEMVSGLKGSELMDEMSGLVDKAIKGVACMIGSTPITPGEYDIILDPDLSGLLAHEAFGHGVEMDMFVKERAKAASYLNKAVASDIVSMYDGAKSYKEVSSYLFDDEGTLGSSTKIIDDGILKAGISDLLSAMRLKTVPTGNGKRESYERKAYARMTNTFFDKGSDKLESMIGSIEHGYLLEGFFSGMEDPKNWGIQCVASRAKEIRNGQLTGKVHSPVYLTGYVPDLLKSITMASEEMLLIGNGTCSKGNKERSKTATGGPFLKARGRLS